MLNDLKAGLFPGLVVTALVVYALFVLVGIPIFSTDVINVVAGGVGSILGVAVKLVTAGILLLICLLPAYIANRRRHHQRTAILAMNICIGLTLIGGSVAVSGFGAIIGGLAALAVIGWAVTGWMAALIWALTAPKRIDADGFVIG